jgi:hypothetical protein
MLVVMYHGGEAIGQKSIVFMPLSSTQLVGGLWLQLRGAMY